MKNNVVLKIIGIFIIAVLILVAGYIIFMVVTDYRPEKEININIENNSKQNIEQNDELSITTFNTGYCGIDKDVDFFMDGGTMSRAISKEKVIENVTKIADIMKELNSDIYFLQEVDKKSTRSFNVNQYEEYKNKFNEYGEMFATNYKVPWVPVPITKPHGKVLSGIMTLCKYKVEDTTRYDLPGKESFFRQLGDLDRCMMVSRINVDSNKELVLINVHLSAYDEGGKVRVEQLKFVQEFLNKEYEKGNYIVLGGDFNEQIPGTDYKLFKTTQKTPNWIKEIPKDFLPKGFYWACDKTVPTSRTIDVPYKEGENFLSVIDGFVVSDNINVTQVYGSNHKFRYTDHNPVTINFKLNR